MWRIFRGEDQNKMTRNYDSNPSCFQDNCVIIALTE